MIEVIVCRYSNTCTYMYLYKCCVLRVQSETTGTLKVSGYIRGQSLSVNSLVHIPGWGDFQMSQIDAPVDPYPLGFLHSDKRNGTKMVTGCLFIGLTICGG